MICEKQVEVARAFVLTADSFKGLVRSLGVDIRFTVGCADGSTLHPENCDEIFDLPNPKSRAIKSITIATPFGDPTSISISFSDSEFHPITYSIRGEDSDVCSYSDKIEQHIESMSRWYSLLYGSPAKRGILWAVLTAGGWALFGAGIAGLAKTHFAGPHTLLPIAFVCIGLLGISFDKLSGYLFPPATFCIGGGIDRHEKLCQFRARYSLGIIIVMILTGIVAGYLTGHIRF